MARGFNMFHKSVCIILADTLGMRCIVAQYVLKELKFLLKEYLKQVKQTNLDPTIQNTL